MKSTHSIAVALVAATLALGGCASNSSSSRPYDSGGYAATQSNMGYGTIDSITVTRGSGSASGAGAVIGGLVGAALGNQVGSGSGRTAATVAGAATGAMVGNNVEANRNAGSGPEMYQIGVRLDNGDYRTVVQDSVADLRVGNRVRIVDGRAYRY